MCDFDGATRGNYFAVEPVRKIEVEVRVKKLNYSKSAGKDGVTKEILKS